MSDEAIRRVVMCVCHTREQACEHDSKETTVGVEIPTVYDGILFWRCEVCRHMWHRWLPSHGGTYNDHLRRKAAESMEKWANADAEPVSEAGEGGSATAPADVPELG